MSAYQRKVFSLLTFVLVVLLLLPISLGVARADVIFQENFEGLEPWRDWIADNGVWNVGTPTSGPDRCHSGSNCAGTVLDGNYPGSTDSRLISPSIQLPLALDGEEIHIRFWHWFSYSAFDGGHIQLSVYDQVVGEWSVWENIGDPIVKTSPIWSRAGYSLIDHGGEKIRLAFSHYAGRPVPVSSESSGWYIDDIEITGPAPVCPQAVFDSSTGIFRIPCALLDGIPEQQYDVELAPPYNAISVTPK